MSGTDPYRIRDFVPDFDAIAAEFVARSRALSARATIRADIAYGTRPREVLDLVFPDKPAAGAPLHVFVHGGYWRSGEKADYRLVAAPVLAAGGIAALVEYDLMPDQRLPVLVDQVRRAVLWLQDNAPSFGADAGRITVSGHSAGAHLASYLSARGLKEAVAPTLPDIKALLLLSGIYDLADIPDSFLRDEAEMTRQEAADWSPMDAFQLAGAKRIIAYGEDETPPFLDQAATLHQHLAIGGMPAEVLPVANANHMNVVLNLADPHSELGRRIADLVSQA
ncbi:alpha/beta hydrolase fold domain-containing protein [Chelativorans sp. ZYF759]|uniref:alpha/beta hydrolase n=1 Tax=Chelativorans sp. ZYF759 TaxID=2692213 RepID=UPI00145EEA4D|nr:alpha/beta hydrolase [Chelativorans sp. ZYF759]NMG41116.1 alpha/beta hydrolase fold domain-containing protein [Chelativorans sp. ZYF759]